MYKLIAMGRPGKGLKAGNPIIQNVETDELGHKINRYIQGPPPRITTTHSVWTNGVFDILHTGYNHLFRFCRQYGMVIVGINSDESAKNLNKSHPLINNEIDRALMVIEHQNVDYVVIFDEPNPIACLELIKPDYFIKGGDYTIDQLPENEKAVVESYGGKVLVSGNVEGKSTSGIYEKIFNEGFDRGIDHANYMMVEGK